MKQGYIKIKRQEMNDEEFTEFQKLTSQYLVNFHKVRELNGYEYYSCLARDIKLLFDQTDEEGNIIKGFITLLEEFGREPVINGIWEENGLFTGLKEVVTQEAQYDNEGNLIQDQVKEIQGQREYPFNADTHIEFSPPVPAKYDEEGNVVEPEKIVTELIPLHKFSGYGTIRFDGFE